MEVKNWKPLPNITLSQRDVVIIKRPLAFLEAPHFSAIGQRAVAGSGAGGDDIPIEPARHRPYTLEIDEDLIVEAIGRLGAALEHHNVGRPATTLEQQIAPTGISLPAFRNRFVGEVEVAAIRQFDVHTVRGTK